MVAKRKGGFDSEWVFLGSRCGKIHQALLESRTFSSCKETSMHHSLAFSLETCCSQAFSSCFRSSNCRSRGSCEKSLPAAMKPGSPCRAPRSFSAAHRYRWTHRTTGSCAMNGIGETEVVARFIFTLISHLPTRHDFLVPGKKTNIVCPPAAGPESPVCAAASGTDSSPGSAVHLEINFGNVTSKSTQPCDQTPCRVLSLHFK